MKVNRTLLWGMLIGMAISIGGASAIQAWQTKAPLGYILSEADELTDPSSLQQYGSKVRGTLAPFEPHFVVRGGKVTSLDGEAPKGVVVISFDSVEKAKAWYDSPAYQAILPLRLKGAKGRMYLVEGVTTP